MHEKPWLPPPPRGDVGSTYCMVVTQQHTLSNFLLKNARWCSELRHVITFLQLQEQVHSAWRAIGLERQLGVIPFRRRQSRLLGHPIG